MNKLDYINSKIENIRVIKGPHFIIFQNCKNIFKEKFSITKLTDRMGIRLDGPKIENIKYTNIKSED